MMKNIFVSILAAVMLFVFTTCAADGDTAASPAELIPAHEADAGQEVVSWREAYAKLLREYAARSIGYCPWASCANTPNPPGGYFMLFDINGDGVPELIVTDRFHFISYEAAYTFSDGLIPLETAYFYGYATRFFSLPGGRHGLGMESNEGVWNSAAVLIIDGNRLIPEITLRRGEGDFGTWWRINEETVTEDEHDRLYASLFGDLDERNWLFLHRITEANIYRENLTEIYYPSGY